MTEISRRKFIQLTVVGSAVAASGCDVRPLSRYPPGLYRAEVTGQYGGYDNRVYPYLNQPDGLQDGVPQYFATVCQMCPAGCGLLVRTMGGRAVKIEGNPAHPVSGGKTCARGQAALQHLYNPDRLRRPALHAKRGQTFTRDRDKDANPPDGREKITEVAAAQSDWETALGRVVQGLQAAPGRVAILADALTHGTSPTQMRLLNEFAAATGARVVTYSLLDDAPWRAAARAVYGRDQVPAYQLDQADVIVSFGGDFLEAWPSPVYYNRLFGEFRQGPRRAQGEHGRFLYIGPRMSMTAAKADLWLPCNPGTEAVMASALRAALGGASAALAPAAATSGLTEAQLQGVADEMRRAGPRAVAVPGNGLMNSANATAAFTAVEALNTQIGSQCVGFGTAAIAPSAVNNGGAGFRGIQQLVQAMQGGQVGALLILGQPNPVFTLPAATGFTEALAKVSFVAALTPFEDETTAWADVVLPTRTFLEDWGDHVPPVIPPGVRMATLQQPIIDPKFIGGDGVATKNPPAPWMDTRPLGDLLTDLAGRLGKPLTATEGRAAVRRAWAGIGQANLAADTAENDEQWVSALAMGGAWKNVPPGTHPAAGGVGPPEAGGRGVLGGASGLSSSPLPAGEGGEERAGRGSSPSAGASFALHLYPQIYFTDGRHANLGWMQENPDPMTMAVWNSWVEINMQVAHSLGIRTGDTVRLTSAHGSVEVPAVPYPGLHPQAVAMPIGQGHEVYGRNAAGRGVNPLLILDPTADAQTGALAYSATAVTIKKVASAKVGYWPGETLVLVQDRPGGQEPEVVKDLIHTTAKEWKAAQAASDTPKSE
jgi:anaerobic selenocysteine-containing dehydrogenase